MGANVQDVARGMGLDGRIGKKFLHAGPGYGGSCFPKDTVALVRTAQEYGSPARLVEAVVQVNDTRKGAMASRVMQACGGSVRGKTVGVLGVAFKPNTDDMREAPSLAIVPALQDAGATVRAYDPAAMDEARPLLPGVHWCVRRLRRRRRTPTCWCSSRSGTSSAPLDFGQLGQVMRSKVLVDLRNVYRPEDAVAAGFQYSSIGRRT